MESHRMNRRAGFALGLFIFLALAFTCGCETALARRIAVTGDARACVSSSVVLNYELKGASICLLHNACERTIFATIDAYPFYARRSEPPVHAKVSHWLKPGDNQVFGWNGVSPTPKPECNVVDSHY
jgi:hypothetical protein